MESKSLPSYEKGKLHGKGPYHVRTILIAADSVLENQRRAKEMSAQLRKCNIEVITENDHAYPQHLKATLGKQCPPVLFAKGNTELLSSVSIGFCGSRKASSKGIAITSQCAEQLVEHGITVVSGYAAGTDMAAHTSAMQHGGRTVFVLAEGILNFTEKNAVKEHLNTENHVFVSQFLPDSSWFAANAMKRNALIIGLSNAMILVESGMKGGTFAAGEEALKLGKPIFVIDYAKPEASAEANRYFLKRGGQPIRGRNGVPNLEKVISAISSDDDKNDAEQLMLDLRMD